MTDPLFGKQWKMSRAASAFSTAFSPETETRLYEERPNGYKLTVSGVHGGKEYSWGYEAYHDGKPYPVHGRDDVDSITIFRLNDARTVGFFELAGSVAGPYARRLSDDGNSLTVEAAGRRDGTPFYDVINYHL